MLWVVGMKSINPLAKLIASVILGVVLIVSLDPITAAVALVLEILLLPWVGIPTRRLLKIVSPLLIAAPFAALTTLLYGRDGGAVLIDIGPWKITEAEVYLAFTIFLRVLAIALPGIVLFATTDPTDLADSLAQLWKLPARFTVSALAALRTLGMMRQDWRMLTLARRARGIANGGSISESVTRWSGQAFALFAIAIRRGSLVAIAMESRGFDAPVKRTWARQAQFGAKDWLFIGGALLIATVAVMCSVMVGAWHVVIG